MTEIRDDTIERTSIVSFGLLREFYRALRDRNNEADVLRGLVMGMTMFLDEEVGPMACRTIMRRSPDIILKTDAHVTPEQVEQFIPVLNAMGQHLIRLQHIV